MKRQLSWADRLLEKIDLMEETMPNQSILELCNDERVLIENHFGVLEYSLERICVKVRIGQLVILGNNLYMRKMQGQVLVICGRIKQIEIKRGCK